MYGLVRFVERCSHIRRLCSQLFRHTWIARRKEAADTEYMLRAFTLADTARDAHLAARPYLLAQLHQRWGGTIATNPSAARSSSDTVIYLTTAAQRLYLRHRNVITALCTLPEAGAARRDCRQRNGAA